MWLHLNIGVEPGGVKYTRAQELGIPMLDEAALLRAGAPEQTAGETVQGRLGV